MQTVPEQSPKRQPICDPKPTTMDFEPAPGMFAEFMYKPGADGANRLVLSLIYREPVTGRRGQLVAAVLRETAWPCSRVFEATDRVLKNPELISNEPDAVDLLNDPAGFARTMDLREESPKAYHRRVNRELEGTVAHE